ncbi:MAG: 3-hydroxyacyl-CoA dehydrogenase NAD-binding domain-containing protein [Gemmatimonadales bacterium]
MGTHLDARIEGGIAILSFATQPAHQPNTFNDATIGEFEETVRPLFADPDVRGIVITSSKPDFIVGADLQMLAGARALPRATFFERVRRMQLLLRDLERCGKPVVAAINGTAVGGGFELALACHVRVAADLPAIRVGLPEVKLGLLPGAGGTQRMPRLIGIREALGLITQGKTIPVGKAAALGLIHEVVPADQLLTRAIARARELDGAVQPWDVKGFRIPGGEVHSPGGFETFSGGNAMITKETWGNYPAPRLAADAVYHGLQLPIDQGLKIEARNFVELAYDPKTAGMIRTLFFGMSEAKRLKTRPKSVPTKRYSSIGVIGAGLMGHGIAHAAAINGVEVVLLDVDAKAAEHGKERIGAILMEAVGKGRLSESDANAALARVHPTADYATLGGCQLVIEAVFEKRELKNSVIERVEAAIAPDAIVGSNTSTLPITGLAQASQRPDRFIGLHFFSPVQKMPLVEVILGERTSEATLAEALDLVKAIGKTPIVVRDGRGFFTSRVFGTYVTEGVGMLAEGVLPALIDNAGRLAGMPMGALTVADMVNIDLSHKIRQQTKADLGDAYQPQPADGVIDFMVERGRYGQKTKAGFFDYQDGDKRLWPELTTHFPPAERQPELEAVTRRLLHIQAIETLRCMEEGVVQRPQDADVGSILGWGFCPFYGGIASYVDYVGAARLLAECEMLAREHGPRFAPPELLKSMAADGRTLYQ